MRTHRLTRARRVTRRGLGAGRRLFRRVVLRLYARWRRSIQVRVVTWTLLISAVVVAILGVFLMQQITTALLEGKEKSALLQLDEGLSILQRDLSPGRVPGVTLNDVTKQLTARSGPSGLYEVYVRDTREQFFDGYSTNEVLPQSVPERLRKQVSGDRIGSRHSTYSEISYIGRESAPGLVVGAGDGRYELYYLFPLTQEQDTLTTVANTLVGVSAVLVVLLAAIASLVTRQVVIPVRLAAGAAERLAAGRLGERMKVRGDDDLARLAASFNDMAGNLQEKIVELQELSQVQRQFVSDVSHELRTPLTTIRIAADMLYEHREHFGDPAVGRSAELLQSQLERFESLLADLLEISRHDAGAATLDAESVDVRDLVLRAVGDTEGLAERKGSKLVLQLPGEPCMAEVDRRRVERILRNLLVNAVEHGEGEDIVVSVGADRDAVAMAVRDHGVGLKPGEAQMVFDRFWRADPARARTTGGTGLGLSIAREDAQLHGGWLQAWGEPGKGSQFRLSLPRTAGTELRGSPLPLVPPETDLPRTAFSGLPASDQPDPSGDPAAPSPDRPGEPVNDPTGPRPHTVTYELGTSPLQPSADSGALTSPVGDEGPVGADSGDDPSGLGLAVGAGGHGSSTSGPSDDSEAVKFAVGGEGPVRADSGGGLSGLGLAVGAGGHGSSTSGPSDNSGPPASPPGGAVQGDPADGLADGAYELTSRPSDDAGPPASPPGGAAQGDPADGLADAVYELTLRPSDDLEALTPAVAGEGPLDTESGGGRSGPGLPGSGLTGGAEERGSSILGSSGGSGSPVSPVGVEGGAQADVGDGLWDSGLAGGADGSDMVGPGLEGPGFGEPPVDGPPRGGPGRETAGRGRTDVSGGGASPVHVADAAGTGPRADVEGLDGSGHEEGRAGPVPRDLDGEDGDGEARNGSGGGA
ncbi:MtrAB system histidine kinase MtrB [Thermomonospora umbrina]|uniref:MtrAB system histidine kinase MtrB n=1 Tax=Thermomonospora umbrina TaxID=111806 RepID=UPI001B85BF46